ncbi:hypothetical protein [Synechococcus elongatus]|uniref:Uncharacterized protein n=1 Tax=Synechococcus elongatus PCC 11801 TaxID=2219813 RepID=A0AAQ3MCC5_SYNEL|nr:hypothetical protein [Synechococcus elongatus]
MGKNVILSAVVGYSYDKVDLFLSSALRNTSADVILIASKTSPQLRHQLLSSPRVKLVTIDFQGELTEMVFRRFFIAKEILAKIEADEVLLSDARDVYFQSDPFGIEGIVFAEEPQLIASCQVNSSWVKKYLGEDEYQIISSNPVLCAGTILGERLELISFLEHFTQKMSSLRSRQTDLAWGVDQACLNSMVWNTHSNPTYKTSRNYQGFALTLFHEQSFLINAEGRLINRDRSIIPVIHQYDRFPWLAQHLRTFIPS